MIAERPRRGERRRFFNTQVLLQKVPGAPAKEYD
jgi:hypothetical protein